MINRKVAPSIQDPVAFDLQLRPYEHYTLDNGTPVYTINAGTQDVLSIELVFYAGNWYEDQNVVAATTNFLLKNGTSRRTAFEINEHFEFYGAYLNRRCHNETASISLHCLSKHVSELLPVIGELVTDSVFPEEELDIYKQNQKQRLEVNLKKCDFVANRLIDEYLYGFEHPYGRYTSTLAYDDLQREQLLQFFKQYYTHGKCLIFVAGLLPNNMVEQINAVFGALPFNKDPLPQMVHTPRPAAEKVAHIINDKQGVQSAIRLATPFPNRHHPDYPKAQVLNSIFGGYFGSRLMSNIREDKGYTYGIHSHIENHIQTSAWVISTEAGRKVTTATVREIHHEMERLCNEPVAEEELYLVRNYMIGTLLGDLDGPFQIINRWKNYILHGLDRDYFYKSLDVIKTLDTQELQALANKYLQPANFYELTVI